MPADWQRVKAIVLAAVEQPGPAERAAFLEQACGADAALRRQVEALLRQHAQAGGLLESPPVGLGQTVDSDHGEAVVPPPPPPALRPQAVGSRIGPYKLLQQLGEGGMGTVYLAEQQEPVQRRVALKVVKAGMDTRQILARFEQERQALALMDHPHIAKVLDAGSTQAGRPYFVMELVKGIPITSYCDRQRLTPWDRLALFIPVCKAVQHAHQKGIIHRDLKPSNVLIALYDGMPAPKVIDFGVAKATAQKLTEGTVFTEVGQMVGTLEYMAPEQAELNNLDIDTRADIYSLGVILYELLTGSPPFTATELRAGAYTDLFRILREVEPPRPSTKLSSSKELSTIAAHRRLEPRRLTRLVHGDLDWVVMKCLEKDRGRRYETANALARDLERYLHDEAVEAGPPSAAYRLRKLAHKYRAPLRVAGVLVLLLALAAAAGVWLAVRATLAERAAVRERDRAEQNFRLARDAVDRYFTKVSESPAMKAHGLEHLRKDLLLQAKEFYERFVSRQPEEPGLQAELANGYFRLGDILQLLGETAAAEANYGKAVAIFEDLSRREPGNPEHRRRLAHTQRALGALFRDTSRPRQAQPLLEQAVAVAEALAGEPGGEPEYQHELALACYTLGEFWRHGHRLAPAEEAYQRAIAIEERLVGEHADESGKYHNTLAASAANLAEVYRLGGRHEEAEASCRRAVEIYEKLAGELPGEGNYQQLLAAAYHVMAGVHQDANHVDKAEAPLRQAAIIGEKLVRAHPDVLDYVVLLAGCYSRLARFDNNRGKPQAVLAWCDKGIQTLQQVLEKEPRHSQAGRDLNDLRVGRAVALAQTGDFAQAAKSIDEMARQEGLTPVDLFNVACVYARCLEAADNDVKRPAADRARLTEQYAGRAMDALRQALARGFRDVPVLRTEPDLAPLRRREDFQKLLQEVGGKR
jgi:serine/threonine protein kinase/tetratricopeptide (TPR) repeat protein